jgi:hypothetical protein
VVYCRFTSKSDSLKRHDGLFSTARSLMLQHQGTVAFRLRKSRLSKDVAFRPGPSFGCGQKGEQVVIGAPRRAGLGGHSSLLRLRRTYLQGSADLTWVEMAETYVRGFEDGRLVGDDLYSKAQGIEDAMELRAEIKVEGCKPDSLCLHDESGLQPSAFEVVLYLGLRWQRAKTARCWAPPQAGMKRAFGPKDQDALLTYEFFRSL